ncbi:MAG: glycosyl transferase [Cyanobium sp.]
MSDFFQNGIVTTLHDLGSRSREDLEAEVARQVGRSPVALVLPCLASELDGPALAPFVRHLSTMPWLGSIVVGLDQADREAYERAQRLLAALPQPHQVIWNDGPRVTALVQEWHQAGLAPRDRGKGHNIWLGLGLVQALGQAEVVALHDCDVVSFEPRMLARLVFPVVHQESGYVFAKGFYPRISREVMYGRVSRLFVTPLIRALRRCVPPSRYLEFLVSFRYPLAGECAMRISAARRLHLPSDWGMEIGVLTEVFRDYSTRQLCQVDIAAGYDHKHQVFDLHQSQPDRGLARMSRDITLSLFRGLASQGQVVDLGLVRTVVTAYQRVVLDLMDSYAHDAAINSLQINRGQEQQAVDFFATNLFEAGRRFVEEDRQIPLTPTLDEVSRLRPDALPRLVEAVGADTAAMGQP